MSIWKYIKSIFKQLSSLKTFSDMACNENILQEEIIFYFLIFIQIDIHKYFLNLKTSTWLLIKLVCAEINKTL